VLGHLRSNIGLQVDGGGNVVAVGKPL